MAVIGLGLAGMATGLMGAGMQSSAAKRAAAAQEYASKQALDYLKQSEASGQAWNLLNLAQTRQALMPAMKGGMTAQNMLMYGLGMNVPEMMPQAPIGTNLFAPGTTDTRSIGGMLIGGAPGTPTGGTQGLQYTSSGEIFDPYTGKTYGAPGFDLQSLMGPVAGFGVQPGAIQQGQFLGGPTAADVEALINPEKAYILKMAQDAMRAEALKSGTYGGGGFGTSLLGRLSDVTQAQLWDPAYNRAASNQANLFSRLQSLVTGLPAGVTGTTSALGDITGTQNKYAGQIAGIYPAMGSYAAQGIVGGTDPWAQSLSAIGRQAMGTAGKGFEAGGWGTPMTAGYNPANVYDTSWYSNVQAQGPLGLGADVGTYQGWM